MPRGSRCGTPPIKADSPISDALNPPGMLLALLDFHGRYLPGSDRRDPVACRERLREGGRRDPRRFLDLFYRIRRDDALPDIWAVSILHGVVQRLENPAGDAASAPPLGSLAGQPAPSELRAFLREQMGWPTLWEFPAAAADALQAAIGFTPPPQDLVPALLRLAAHRDPTVPEGPTDEQGGVRGRAAAAGVTLAARFGEAEIPVPPLLASLLFRLAADPHPTVVQSLVGALPPLAAAASELAWRLFHAAARRGLDRLIPAAETFLRSRLAEDEPAVRRMLDRMARESKAPAGAPWGDAMAQAVLDGRLPPDRLPALLFRLTGFEAEIQLHNRLAAVLSATESVNPKQRRRAIATAAALSTDPAARPARLARLIDLFHDLVHHGEHSLEAPFRIAYNLIQQFPQTADGGNRPAFFAGMETLAGRAPLASRQLLDALMEEAISGRSFFSQVERERIVRMAREIGCRTGNPWRGERANTPR